MKFNRLGAFTLGVVITAVSVGAVSFVNAEGDATLKACADKKSGAMRYISKGSCKKTETALSWNQMGLQGATGAPGEKGDTGAPGAIGDSGAAGGAGTTGNAGTVKKTTIKYAALSSCSPGRTDYDAPMGSPWVFYPFMSGTPSSTDLVTPKNWKPLKFCTLEVLIP